MAAKKQVFSDFEALFIMGLIWFIVGMFLSNTGLFVLGLIFLIAGLVKSDRLKLITTRRTSRTRRKRTTRRKRNVKRKRKK